MQNMFSEDKIHIKSNQGNQLCDVTSCSVASDSFQLEHSLGMDPCLSEHFIHPGLLASPSVALDYPLLPSPSQSS